MPRLRIRLLCIFCCTTLLATPAHAGMPNVTLTDVAAMNVCFADGHVEFLTPVKAVEVMRRLDRPRE